MTQRIMTCDKCGKAVLPHNNALYVEEIVSKTFIMGMGRHLYPEGDCEGSPSRVKKVESDKKWARALEKVKSRPNDNTWSYPVRLTKIEF